MTKGTVLVVGSNATRIELQDGGSAAIGQYLNETVVPVMALIEGVRPSGYGAGKARSRAEALPHPGRRMAAMVVT